MPVGTQTAFFNKIEGTKDLTQEGIRNIKVGHPVIKCRATMLNVEKMNIFFLKRIIVLALQTKWIKRIIIP